MSLINFLFGTRTPAGFKLEGAIEFEADLTLEETHERTSEISQNPIESGGFVSDHVILNPERVTIQGFQTDTPAAVLALFRGGRTQDAFEKLESAWKSREPMTLVTGRKTYKSMMITRLSLPRDRPKSMAFTIELQKIQIVETQTGRLGAGFAVAAGALSSAAEASPSPEVANLASAPFDAGRQPTTAPSPNAANRASTLFQSLSSVGIL